MRMSRHGLSRSSGIQSALRFERLEDRRLLAMDVKADIVFVVDESGSESGILHTWLTNSLAPQLENNDFAQSLRRQKITDIKYGVIGFSGPSASGAANSYVVNQSGLTRVDKLSGRNTPTQLVTALGNLTDIDGDNEDGWDGLEHAIAEFPFRDGAVPVVILVQNEQGRVFGNRALTYEGIAAALQSKNVLLNSMVVGDVATDIESDLWAAHDLFDLSSYEITSGAFSGVRVMGVEADVSSVGERKGDGSQFNY